MRTTGAPSSGCVRKNYDILRPTENRVYRSVSIGVKFGIGTCFW